MGFADKLDKLLGTTPEQQEERHTREITRLAEERERIKKDLELYRERERLRKERDELTKLRQKHDPWWKL